MVLISLSTLVAIMSKCCSDIDTPLNSISVSIVVSGISMNLKHLIICKSASFLFSIIYIFDDDSYDDSDNDINAIPPYPAKLLTQCEDSS